MKIIGFTAKKQTGKTTAVRYMIDKLTAQGKSVAHINFKDALITEITYRFPQLLQVISETMDMYEYDGMNPWTIERLFETKPRLIRALMQNYGTEVRRADDPDYWVKKWSQEVGVTKFSGAAEYLFVDDIRFMNEANMVRQFDGLIFRLERNDTLIGAEDTHSSETEMDLIQTDAVILNDFKDRTVLYGQLDAILENVDKVA